MYVGHDNARDIRCISRAKFLGATPITCHRLGPLSTASRTRRIVSRRHLPLQSRCHTLNDTSANASLPCAMMISASDIFRHTSHGHYILVFDTPTSCRSHFTPYRQCLYVYLTLFQSNDVEHLLLRHLPPAIGRQLFNDNDFRALNEMPTLSAFLFTGAH